MSDPRSLLETFDNQFPNRDYTIEIVCPEFYLGLPQDGPARLWHTDDLLQHARPSLC